MFGEVVHGHDVGMFQPGDGLGLALEALQEGGVLEESRVENLDGYVAIQGGVVGLVDRGHAALAELFDDSVRTNILTDRKRHGTPPQVLATIIASGGYGKVV